MTMPPESPSRPRLLLAAAAAVLLLSACSGASQPVPADSPAAAPADTAGAPTPEASPDAAGPATPPSGVGTPGVGTPTPLPVLQARETATSDGPVRMAVNSLVVRGDVMTLNFTATNIGDDNWMPWTSISRGGHLK